MSRDIYLKKRDSSAGAASAAAKENVRVLPRGWGAFIAFTMKRLLVSHPTKARETRQARSDAVRESMVCVDLKVGPRSVTRVPFRPK